MTEPWIADAPHWQQGEESEHPLVARLCGVDIYSETGYLQAHVTVGCHPDEGSYLKGPDGQPVDRELVKRGWLLIGADGSVI